MQSKYIHIISNQKPLGSSLRWSSDIELGYVPCDLFTEQANLTKTRVVDLL
jgi:hypothetical protein